MRTKRGRAGLGLTEFILGWTLLGGGGGYVVKRGRWLDLREKFRGGGGSLLGGATWLIGQGVGGGGGG